jgi:hypothetical protein
MKKLIETTLKVLGIITIIIIIVAAVTPQKEPEVIQPVPEEDQVRPTNTPRKPTETPVNKPTIGPTQNIFYENYMEACGMDDYCQCTYDYMIDNHGFDKFLSLSIDYVETQKMPEELLDAVDYCSKIKRG